MCLNKQCCQDPRSPGLFPHNSVRFCVVCWSILLCEAPPCGELQAETELPGQIKLHSWCRPCLLRNLRNYQPKFVKYTGPLTLIVIRVEGLMLKLQFFDHLMQRADSLEKTLMLGKIEGRRRRGRQRMRWFRWHCRLNRHEPEQTAGDSEGQGSLACCSPQGFRVRYDLVTEQQWVSLKEMLFGQ